MEIYSLNVVRKKKHLQAGGIELIREKAKSINN